MTKTTRATSVVVYLLFAAITLLLEHHQLDLPLCGDEGDFYGGMVLHFQTHPLFTFDTSTNPFEVYHPPTYYRLLGLLTSLLGWKLPVLRVTACLTSAALPTAVFLLARLWAGALFSALSAATLVLSPLYLSQSVLLHPDILAAAFVLFSLHALLERRPNAAAICFAAACAVNGSAALSAPFLVVALAGSERPTLKSVTALFLPGVILTAVWVALYVAHLGGAAIADLKDPNLFGHSPGDYLGKALVDWPQKIFIASGRWVLTAAYSAWVFVTWRKDPRAILLAVLFVSQIALLSLFEYVNERYAAVPIAALSIAGAWAVAGLSHARPRPIRAAGALSIRAAGALSIRAAGALTLASAACYGLAVWYTPLSADNYYLHNVMYNVSYFGKVKALRNLASDLEASSPGAVVVARWPWSSALQFPFLGFVSTGFRVAELPSGDFTLKTRPPTGALLAFPGELKAARTVALFQSMGVLHSLNPDRCRSWIEGRGRFNLCPLD